MLTTLVVVALGLVTLVLFTPVELSLRCERRPVFRYRLVVHWLFGLVGTRIDPTRSKAKPSKPKKRKRKRKPRRRPLHVGAMLMTRGFLRGAVRLLERLAHAVRMHVPLVWLRAGLEDPADTGLVSAWILPFSTYLAARGPGRFDVAPDFSGETLRFELESNVRVIPARLLWPVVAFGLSPSTLRGLFALRRGRAG